jgi:hypothetical protein
LFVSSVQKNPYKVNNAKHGANPSEHKPLYFLIKKLYVNARNIISNTTRNGNRAMVICNKPATNLADGRNIVRTMKTNYKRSNTPNELKRSIICSI